ncbi:MAG: alpha/beta hydrolase [Spirochaetia bacterium]|nr:alpha/beta hydrolase [Spirochaetia bacterium]
MNPLDSKDVAERVYYPTKVIRNTPHGARDFDIPVSGGDTLGARFYLKNPELRTVLYFHGNGETVPDYDDIALMFHAIDMNLFVVDYRGYGWSTGYPTLRQLSTDPPEVAKYFLEKVVVSPLKRPLVFGRSLGSSPATDVAVKFPDNFSGLILESGFAEVTPLLHLLGVQLNPEQTADADRMFSNSHKLKSIRIPALILHGEQDQLIQVAHARKNFSSLPANKNKLEIFSGSGHNDLIARNRSAYFKSIYDFSANLP